MQEPILYRIVRPIVNVLFRLIYRPTMVGLEYIPKTGRVVLAGNHKHNFDALFLMSSTKRVVHFLGKKELIDGKFGFIFKRMGIIPVNRKIKDSGPIKAAKEILRMDHVVGIFPEGTFNRSEEATLPFKIGAVKMAYETDSPIVPFVIKGSYRPFRKGLKIEFLKPFYIQNANLTKENEAFMTVIRQHLKGEK